MDDNKIKENQKNRIIPHVPEDERFYICSEDKKINILLYICLIIDMIVYITYVIYKNSVNL